MTVTAVSASTRSGGDRDPGPGKDFQGGLAQTVAWYRANPAWWEPLKQRSGWTPGAAGVTGKAP